MTLVFRSLLALGAATLALAPAPASAAPSKDQCVDANTQAQDLRRDGKLLGARDALRLCANDACPRLVRVDCTKRLDDLESSLPSVVFAARDGAGNDLSAVAVSMDGKSLVDHLDGTALDVDPGEHSFSFTAAGQPTTTLKFVLREGEHARHESILIGPPAAPAAPLGAAPSESLVSPPEPEQDLGARPGSTQRLLGWSALGAGVVGLVIGTVFELKRSSKLKSRNAICADNDPNECPSGSQARVDALTGEARSAATVGTIGLIAGGALAAGGVVLILSAPSKDSTAVSLAPVISPHFQGLLLSGNAF